MKFNYLVFLLFILSCNKTDRNLVYNQQVTCSAELKSNRVVNLVDTSETTSWNAGSAGLQSFCINFNKAYQINKVIVTLSSDPHAVVTYKILIKKGGNGVFETIDAQSKLIASKDTIQFNQSIEDVSSIQMHIDNPKSWVCVDDIKVIGY